MPSTDLHYGAKSTRWRLIAPETAAARRKTSRCERRAASDPQGRDPLVHRVRGCQSQCRLVSCDAAAPQGRTTDSTTSATMHAHPGNAGKQTRSSSCIKECRENAESLTPLSRLGCNRCDIATNLAQPDGLYQRETDGAPGRDAERPQSRQTSPCGIRKKKGE